MKNLFVLFLLTCFACSHEEKDFFKVEELSPWCILGFDSEDRKPTERIAMLKELGFKKFGYNKGKGHLHEMKEEFKLAKKNDIEITSIFLWLNAKRDSIGKLSQANQELLKNLKEVEQKPTIWLSFSNNFFEGLNDRASINLAKEMILFVKEKADELNCPLALYNHHGWFGNPYHQVEIIKELKMESLTMVYNFHHAQEYVDKFPEIAKMISPYLSFVNLNGVKKEGPQILDIGEGDHEFEMIKNLQAEGFNGPWGILGHIKTEDVKKVLIRNLEGLKRFD